MFFIANRRTRYEIGFKQRKGNNLAFVAPEGCRGRQDQQVQKGLSKYIDNRSTENGQVGHL